MFPKFPKLIRRHEFTGVLVGDNPGFLFFQCSLLSLITPFGELFLYSLKKMKKKKVIKKKGFSAPM